MIAYLASLKINQAFLFCFAQNYILDQLETAYQNLGPALRTSDTHFDILNRVEVLTWLCKYNHAECRSNARSYLQNWKNLGEVIPPDLQTPYFCGAIAKANQDEWDFLYSQYGSATEEPLRVRILNGLGCSENVSILNGYLDKIMSINSTSHKNAAFSSVYNSGSVGLATVLTYIKEHISEIDK